MKEAKQKIAKSACHFEKNILQYEKAKKSKQPDHVCQPGCFSILFRRY